MSISAKSVTLAIDGGKPTCSPIRDKWPIFEQDEIDSAVKVLQSGRVNYWTGEEGRSFEREFAEACGCAHAIALANGTVALELALRVLGISAGDEVITTSRTFLASASCAVMVGAKPVLADVDRASGNITAEAIEPLLTPRTRAIIAVHLAGWPCEMDSIMQLAKKNGLAVIEDCAQAHGATYHGKPIGSIGDIGAFSFCQDKIMTTAGEGGMLTTQDPDIWSKAWSLKDHGKSFDAVYNRRHPEGFRWLHESFGTNWRLSEVQSAVGRVQLRKARGWVEQRRKIASRYNCSFAQLPGLRVEVPALELQHSYYRYYVYVRPERLRAEWNRDRILRALNAEGVPTYSGTCSEIYLEKAFPRKWRPKARLTVAQELGETTIMLPVFHTLDECQISGVCSAVEKVMMCATG